MNKLSKEISKSNASLREIIRFFPQSPGVYRMYDAEDNICYIGKAKRLRSRVLSYFGKYHQREITNMLISRVCWVDYLVTSSEEEALVLESNLIKRHQPNFNIDLKDNKSYPYLLLQTKPYPRLVKTRNQNAKGTYFGPYTNVPLMEAYMQAVNRLYPLKKCRQVKFPKNFKPCLYYHIGECLDYCTGSLNAEKTKDIVLSVKALLSGDVKQVVQRLKEKIILESKALNFEKAQMLKNCMDVLSNTFHRQAVMNAGEEYFDSIGYVTSSNYLVIALLQYREKKLVNKHVLEFPTEIFASEEKIVRQKNEKEENVLQNKVILQQENTLPNNTSNTNEIAQHNGSSPFLIDAMTRFLFDYYKVSNEDVAEILFPQEFHEVCNAELKVAVEAAYKFRNKKRVACGELPQKMPQLHVPLAGKKKNYVKLALVNASYSLQELVQQKNKSTVLIKIKEVLNLPRIPKIIESFDVANTEGTNIVAGMVRYVNGKENKAGYRLFNISLTSKPNDYISMQEAVYRRYYRLKREKKTLPHLIMIDGGKGQLSSALKALTSLGLSKAIPVIALAKREEEVYMQQNKQPIVLKHTEETLRFFVEVRNETHRFVNTFHAKKRGKKELLFGMENIPGIGSKKVKLLLAHFKTTNEIACASEKEICSLPFFGAKDFLALQQYFKTINLKPLYKSNK